MKRRAGNPKTVCQQRYSSLFHAVVCLTVSIVLQVAAVAAPPQQPPGRNLTISVQSQLVQMYLTVTQGDRRVMNLGASDFKLAEDGKLLGIDRLDSQTVPLQIALLFDLSESMRDSLAMTQEAAASFVEALDRGDRVALIFFNSDIRCVPQLTDDREPILHAIRNSRPQGATKLYEALLFAMKYLDGKEGRKAIVCFSDGEDTARASSLKVVMGAAAQYGYPIYTIGAGAGLVRGGLRAILRQLASINSGRVFLVKDPKKLRGAFAEVASDLHSAYVLNYYTQVPFDGRWHSISVSVANPVYKIHVRPGFYARSAVMSALLSDHPETAKKKASSAVRYQGAAAEQAARAAESEILKLEPSTRPLDVELPHNPIGLEPAGSTSKMPVFKVESRIVEVPVLLESTTGKDLALLSEKDFRVYEDDSLREIAFFAREVRNEGIGQLRDSALKSIQAAAGKVPLPPRTDDELLLGRYAIVLDDTMSETGAFLRGKQAAEKIIRAYHNPLRPLSLYFTSQTETNLTIEESTEAMLMRLRRANQHASAALTTNGGIMSIYEGFLIERGDTEAARLAELRFASSLHLTFKNELGEVDGEEAADQEMVRNSVQQTSRMLVGENFADASRTISGLRLVVNSLSSYRGSYPKTILFISTGFVLGRGSGRADAGQMMSDLVAAAKRNGIRIFTLDSGGLATPESLGIEANGAFLTKNPSLERVLQAHASGWQFERESSLSQPAADTGGRLLNNTNDLAAAADTMMRLTGQLYYLAYLSRQPVDAKFHRIRVTTSLGGKARVHARAGYFADRQDKAADSANVDEEPAETLLARAEGARKSGNMELLVGSLEKLSRKLPNRPDIWFNLGSAELRLNHPEQAAKALQKAFVLAPEDPEISFQLSRALLATGDSDAAAETLERLTRRNPNDARTLLQLGRVYESGSRVLEAYQTYRRVLDLKLTPPLDVYLLLARTAVALQRPVEAGLFIKDYLGLGGDPVSVQSLQALEQISRRR